MGYAYEEVVTEMKKTKEGEEIKGTIKRIKKSLPPDGTAQIFWLKNRNPKRWRDKQEVDLNGEMKHQVKIDIKEVKEELKKLYSRKGIKFE